MKKIARLALVLLVALATLAISAACSKSSSTSQPGQRKITTADVDEVLDLTTLLPVRFEQLDASSEHMSRADLGLSKEFSEVALYLSEDPYEMLFGYYAIIETRVERASSDALMKDDDQIKKMVIEGLRQGAAKEGVSLSDAGVEVTHPSIGDLAVFGSGTMSSMGASVGYDILMFKVNKVYMFIFSIYLPGESVSLTDLGPEIVKSIHKFSQ
jgi:hypothetical protein